MPTKKRIVRNPSKTSKKATRKYEMFHGKPVPRRGYRNFRVPKALIKLGDVVSITYACSKLNGGGDGKYFMYEHEFEKPTSLYMDETAKGQLYIMGRSLIVTEAGVEN